MFLDQHGGFYCFSMRFIVMMDLVSMLIQPVTVVHVSVLRFLLYPLLTRCVEYIVYLIV